ncbi:MAG: helix-turn-helix domain-containing protein [Acidobacteria bacterium]|nr:helix-turn-helix domain-containing protein [Acidobacteriota bacterium]
MSSTLGQKLRAAREQRGISISEVAEQTRISPLYLEAIDADNYKTLPGGIFNKGFIRSYAKYVGIDEQEALQEYSRQVVSEDTVDEEKLRTYRPEVLTDDRAASSIVPTVIFAAVILGLMTAGILFLVNYIKNRQNEPVVAVNTANTPVSNALQNTNSTQPPASQAPVMNALKVEFTAVGDAVSLTSVVDNGKGTEALIAPGTPVVFEPKESLKLRYSKSRAEFAQLKLNGKQIVLPSQPVNPKAAIIEIEINQANLAQVWESGNYLPEAAPAISDANSAQPPATAGTQLRATPKPVPVSPKPETAANVNAAANTPPPAAPTMTGKPTMTGRPRATSTPIIAGKPPANN